MSSGTLNSLDLLGRSLLKETACSRLNSIMLLSYDKNQSIVGAENGGLKNETDMEIDRLVLYLI